MSTVTIREAIPADYAAVGALMVRVYVDEGYIRKGSAYADTLARTAERAAESEVLVAEVEGRVVGTITVTPPGSAYAPLAQADELEFRMLAVDASARGTGVGKALVDHVLERAHRDGYRAVAISTMTEMVDARRLYERLGFVHVPERDWEPSVGDRLTVLVRSLVSPARSR